MNSMNLKELVSSLANKEAQESEMVTISIPSDLFASLIKNAIDWDNVIGRRRFTGRTNPPDIRDVLRLHAGFMECCIVEMSEEAQPIRVSNKSAKFMDE